jgi:hypothetical protein
MWGKQVVMGGGGDESIPRPPETNPVNYYITYLLVLKNRLQIILLTCRTLIANWPQALLWQTATKIKCHCTCTIISEMRFKVQVHPYECTLRHKLCSGHIRRMESTNPTTPSLVHDGASSSKICSTARTRDGDDSVGSGSGQFQEMLVLAMRDPKVRAAVLPGATPILLRVR